MVDITNGEAAVARLEAATAAFEDVMTTEADSVNVPNKGVTPSLAKRVKDALVPIEDRAGQSAAQATSKAGESATSASQAAASVTQAENEKLAAQGEADRAKTEADRAAAITGLDTVATAVTQAISDQQLRAASGNSMERMREFNQARFAASGFVHFGKHVGGTNFDPVNEGMWCGSASNPQSTITLGTEYTGGGAGGISATTEAQVHTAGFTTKLMYLNSADVTDLSKIKLPPCEQGTRVYDSETGESINYLTDPDPKYGNVAPDLAEAVARAWEYDLPNADFRLGKATYWTEDMVTTSLANGVITLTGTSGVERNQSLNSDIILCQVGDKFEVEFEITATTTGTSGIIVGNAEFEDSGAHFWYPGKVGVYKGVVTATSTSVSVKLHAGISVGSVTSFKNIKFKKVTKEVVTERVDFAALEGFLARITTDRPWVFKNGLVQSAASDISGVATSDTTYPASFHAVYDGDTTSNKKGVNWFAASVLERDAMLADPDNNIFNLGLDAQGDPIICQFMVRQRSWRGAGNRDWGNISTTKANYARFDTSGLTSLRPQGSLDSVLPFNSGAGNYYKTYTTYPPDIRDDHKGLKGIFVPRDNAANNDLAYDRFCFLLPLFTCSRLNAGVWHPQKNPFGSASCAIDAEEIGGVVGTVAGTKDIPTLLKQPINTAHDCFRAYYWFGDPYVGPGRYADTGAIASGSSTNGIRPDDKMHDALYANGIGGVDDLRLSAWPVTPSDFSRVRSEVESGEYRGAEKLVRMTPCKIDFATNANVSVANILKPDGGILTTDDLPDYTVFLERGAIGVVGDAVNARELGYCAEDPNQKFWISSATGGTVYAWEDATVNDGSIVFMPLLTNLTVSGEFQMTDVYASPQDILQCETLKDGWIGGWGGLAGKVAEYTRKNLADMSRQYTADLGVTWASYSSSIVDSVANTTNVGLPAGIWILNYTAFANQLTECENSEVLNGRDGVGDVYISQSHDKTRSVFIESLSGHINKYAGDASYAGYATLKYVSLADGLLGKYTGSRSVAHEDLASLGVLTTGDSTAVKSLAYQTETNSQAGLAFAFNEVKHDLPTSATNVDGSISNSFIAGERYIVTAGNHAGVYLYCSANSTVTLDLYAISDDGKLRAPNGNVVTGLEVWKGNGWGDSGKVVIVDNVSTFTDDNGQTCLCGTKRLVKPIGWLANNF